MLKRDRFVLEGDHLLLHLQVRPFNKRPFMRIVLQITRCRVSCTLLHLYIENYSLAVPPLNHKGLFLLENVRFIIFFHGFINRFLLKKIVKLLN